MNISSRLISLDLARGASALVVLWAHLCGFLYAPLRDRSNASFIERLLDASSGYGHQAVVIFFVLSGFLVSRSVIQSRGLGFDWVAYFLARLSRLWVVLVPSLVVTLIINLVGFEFDQQGYYDGDLQDIYGGQRGELVSLGLSTFMGNVLFLQTILVPSYGDNEALWSLAYEFWYYILFPVAWRAAFCPGWKERIFLLCLLVALFAFLPVKILLYWSIWLIGALCFILRPIWNKLELPAFLRSNFFSLFVVAVALRLSHSFQMHSYLKDLFLAICFSLVVLNAKYSESVGGGFFRRLIIWLSDISYSLYAVHFSILGLIIVVFFGNNFIDRSIDNIWIGVMISCFILLYSHVFFLIFESRTLAFKNFLVCTIDFVIKK